MGQAAFVPFLANSTGEMNAELLANVSSLGIVGLGWQMADRLATDPARFINPSLFGHLEARQAATAARLKTLRPGLRVLVSADMACTSGFWRVSQEAMANSTLAAELFLHWPNGSIFLDSWGDNNPAPWYNWSNPRAVQYWIHHGPVAEAMGSPHIDGVYLDGADMGVRHGRGVGAYDCHVFANSAQQSKYITDAYTALTEAVTYYRKLQPHKWLTGYVSSRACTSHGGVDCRFHCPTGACAGPTQLAPLHGGPNPKCAPTMRSLITTSNRTDQTLYVEPEPVATFKCQHMDWSKPSDTWDCSLASTRDPSVYVAAFLVARGPSAMFQITVQPMFVLDYVRQFPSLRIEPGQPRGVAQEVGQGVFERDFKNLIVRFDCNHFNASFVYH